MHDILPKVIAIIDGKNLLLLDKIFSLLSFSFKFLLRPIKDNIVNVYSVYFELLKHKNNFIRKFTAQSFSYVVRKLPFEQNLIKMLFEPVSGDSTDDKINGLSDLLLEVLSGQSEDLHSKACSMLNQILMYEGLMSED